MNERQASDLLQRLAVGVQEVPPPLDHLVAKGRVLQRRRNLRHVLGGVAVTLLVLGGAAVLQQRAGGPGRDPAPIEPASPPTAAAGARLVGLGRVAVEVPQDWVVAENGCARDAGVVFRYPDTEKEARQFGPCPPFPDDQPFASLALGDVTSPHGSQVAASSWARQLEINGLSVTQSSFHHGPPEFCGPSGTPGYRDCDLLFWTPAGDTFFRVSVHGPAARETTLAIRDSIQVLPSGYTSVPFIKFGTSVADAAQILESAGLEADLPDIEWPHYVVATEPQAGSVVQSGSTVRLIPGDG